MTPSSVKQVDNGSTGFAPRREDSADVFGQDRSKHHSIEAPLTAPSGVNREVTPEPQQQWENRNKNGVKGFRESHLRAIDESKEHAEEQGFDATDVFESDVETDMEVKVDNSASCCGDKSPPAPARLVATREGLMSDGQPRTKLAQVRSIET